MDTFEEKRSLVLEMIAFSAVDGRLHKREYEFLALVANELGFDLDRKRERRNGWRCLYV